MAQLLTIGLDVPHLADRPLALHVINNLALNTLGFAAFCGLYQLTHCTLAKKRGKSDVLNAAAAGFATGTIAPPKPLSISTGYAMAASLPPYLLSMCAVDSPCHHILPALQEASCAVFAMRLTRLAWTAGGIMGLITAVRTKQPKVALISAVGTSIITSAVDQFRAAKSRK